MWTETTISGRPAEVFDPPDAKSESAVIYLHGYAGESLKENEVWTSLFAKERLRVVRPEGGPCWWLDALSPDFDDTQTPMSYLRHDVMSWIAEQWGARSPRVALLGVSMGGQGALNLAYRHGREFPVVAALSPAIDFHRIYGEGFRVEAIFDDAEAARMETAVLNLHPMNWPRFQFFCSDPKDRLWHEGSERLASKLSSSGVPFESDLRTSRGGHGWEYFNAMAEQAITFVSRSLDSIALESL